MNLPKKIGVTFVGLGPGEPALLTMQAREWLISRRLVLAADPAHPALAVLPEGVRLTSLNGELGKAPSAAEILGSASQAEEITVAVPGSGRYLEGTALDLFVLASQNGLPVRILPGLDVGEYAWSFLGGDSDPALTTLEAGVLARHYIPPATATLPLLIRHVPVGDELAKAISALRNLYPASHPVRYITPGTFPPVVTESTLEGILHDQVAQPGGVLYIPPLEEGSSFEDFQEVIARLRAPDGCPWDREQTHLSLRRHLLEETYETLEALDTEDTGKMAEEFGDLLLQIVLHAQIASEAAEFNMLDIIRGIHHKIIRRHPHVFGELQVGGVQGVLQNWEKLKAAERAARGDKTKGLLDGVPPALPALTQAQEIQERAARVGFDWPQIDGVLAKVGEEINELQHAESEDELSWELGDLLFAVVNVSRWKKIDAETALRDATKRFRQRFAYIENAARAKGKNVSELTFEEMDRLWDAAKGKK